MARMQRSYLITTPVAIEAGGYGLRSRSANDLRRDSRCWMRPWERIILEVIYRLSGGELHQLDDHIHTLSPCSGVGRSNNAVSFHVSDSVVNLWVHSLEDLAFYLSPRHVYIHESSRK